ncbi:hypothetical protein B0O99DRAFT_613929 [Bisporella sp. PMI_857]|nr:hypothetical protein B0O99DRAFT_613929 [Bisporella sp. PMI_857]
MRKPTHILLALAVLFLSVTNAFNLVIQPRTFSASPSSSSASSPTTTPPQSSTETVLTGDPTITAGPSLEDVEKIELQQKWHVETYYSCVTRGTYSHCGWHKPVRPGGSEIAGAEGRGLERRALGIVLMGWIGRALLW